MEKSTLRYREHNRRTRLLHMLIALLVVSQLATSLFMVKPGETKTEDILFEIHEYTGIVGFVLIFVFWGYTLLRERGTEHGDLFPWFFADRRSALWQDLKRHGGALRRFQLPHHAAHAPLPSAIHGLGILLIVAMATSGVGWFVAMKLGDTATSWGDLSKGVHEALSKLVWAYIVGHGGIAVLNHFTGRQSVTEMWSFRPDGERIEQQ